MSKQSSRDDLQAVAIALRLLPSSAVIKAYTEKKVIQTIRKFYPEVIKAYSHIDSDVSKPPGLCLHCLKVSLYRNTIPFHK